MTVSTPFGQAVKLSEDESVCCDDHLFGLSRNVEFIPFESLKRRLEAIGSNLRALPKIEP